MMFSSLEPWLIMWILTPASAKAAKTWAAMLY